jgi:hypothetical protein
MLGATAAARCATHGSEDERLDASRHAPPHE